MNGWKRIGVVITACWILAIVGYAGYERFQLPIKILGEETNNGDFFSSTNLMFFRVATHSRNEDGCVKAATQLVSARTEEGRRQAIVDRDWACTSVFETFLENYFWVCLLLPIISFWALSFTAVFVCKWVVSGFSAKQSNK